MPIFPDELADLRILAGVDRLPGPPGRQGAVPAQLRGHLEPGRIQLRGVIDDLVQGVAVQGQRNRAAHARVRPRRAAVARVAEGQEAPTERLVGPDLEGVPDLFLELRQGVRILVPGVVHVAGLELHQTVR